VVRDDLRDLERVREVSLIELPVDILPERAGSPLSGANLSRDVEVDHKTLERWLTILENMHICFRLAPFGSPRIRAVKKEKDTDRREVDFVVLRGGRPQFAVECRTGDRAISPAVRCCAERAPIPRFLQVHRGGRHDASGKVTVLPFTTFCTERGVP
jgi:hypothetical protein